MTLGYSNAEYSLKMVVQLPSIRVSFKGIKSNPNSEKFSVQIQGP